MGQIPTKQDSNPAPECCSWQWSVATKLVVCTESFLTSWAVHVTIILYRFCKKEVRVTASIWLIYESLQNSRYAPVKVSLAFKSALW